MVRCERGGAPNERQRRRAEKRLSKRVFLESPFLLCRLKGFQDLSGVLRANLKGAEKKRTLQNHPFGQPFLRTMPSPLLWRTLRKGPSFHESRSYREKTLKSASCRNGDPEVTGKEMAPYAGKTVVAMTHRLLGPAKTYILRGTPRIYAIKTRAVTDN